MTFFALFDDVASLLDDTSAMTKIAAKKTASVLGDDLAVNAEQASGFGAKRELVAIKKIAIGALKNKVILLPIIFALSYILPAAIIVLLVLGGLFLSFEGAEAIEEIFSKHEEEEEMDHDKIKGAIKTDFVLSIEIIVIAFSTVMDKPFINQVITVTIIAFAAVVFVYGLVGLIVRLDDFGFWLSKKGYKSTGAFFIKSLAYIIFALKYIGMFAMFLVAGGIFTHNIHFLHELVHNLEWYLSIPLDLLISIVVGFVLVVLVDLIKRFKK